MQRCQLLLNIFSVSREIDERMEFLEEMQGLGHHYVRKYEATIKAEIADKANQLEKLKLEEAVAEEDSHDLFKS